MLTLRSEDAGMSKGGEKRLISEGMESVAEGDDSPALTAVLRLGSHEVSLHFP